MTDEVLWADWTCAVCGAGNESPVDPALGVRQRFTEDCGTCCRPNLVSVVVRGPDDLEVTAEFDE